MGRIRATGANNTTETLYVKGVLCDPSAGSWVVTITNTAGQTVFSARGSDAVTRYYPVEDTWVGANISTSTNMTATYIYYK